MTFDLTGLPPTPEEVDAFLADDRPDAYERLVDRLLASPHYGERWAQHWLDLAHYADSNGFELDAERPDAWRYRDWVVKALNADMPYDRFVALQLAGDEIEPGDRDALIATGFGRCGPREVVGGNVDPGGQAADRADRDHRHGRLGLPRPDDRLRPLPRPQVRRDPDDRLLPPPVLLRGVASWSTCRSPRRPEIEAFEAAKKAVEREGRPAQEAAGRARGPLSQGARRAEARHADAPTSGR